jgi:PBSX family phage terminase large subunit
MILTPSQGTVADSRHRYRVICCGRRWGKTTLAVEEIKGRALFTKANIAYIAPTYQQARDIAWEMLKKELRGASTSINESRLEIKINNVKGEESMISLRGWESIDSLRGLSFDMLVIDEVAMMRNFWSSWQEVVRPTLTDRKGEVMFISTPKGFNHFYELYNMELDPTKGKEYKSFHFTSYDNPHLAKEEIDKARSEITETRFAQEYLADFKKVEGLVYKEFDRNRHLYDTLPQDTHYDFLGGVDFGFNNPAAVPHIKRDARGVYWVDNEWYQTGRTENQIADYVLSCKFHRVYPDPENPSAISLLAQKGVNVREVIKNKDSVKNGINKVRDLFKQNKLMINKRCINLIAELESYCYPDSIDGMNESENPIKENDHLLDAIRYVIYMEHLVRRKIVEEKPRAVVAESKYEGKVPAYKVDDDEVTEEELARM